MENECGSDNLLSLASLYRPSKGKSKKELEQEISVVRNFNSMATEILRQSEGLMPDYESKKRPDPMQLIISDSLSRLLFISSFSSKEYDSAIEPMLFVQKIRQSA